MKTHPIPHELLQSAVHALGRKEKVKRALLYIAQHPGALTHHIERDCAVGRFSDAAYVMRPIIEQHGLQLVGRIPDPPITDRFGCTSLEHVWHLELIEQPEAA